ncbi:MAG: TonB-dependent receptor, partial [Gemmatimonadota bacterium]
GFHAGQLDASKWALSARGFNDVFANKLLVLMDGRSVYTNTFSGVFWEVQDALFEDIERIEAVRGPGSTTWGTNAVNGVINVVSRSARDTQGGLLSAGGGLEERASAAFRYGGRLGSRSWYRVWGKGLRRDSFVDADGGDAGDAWWVGRLGGRADWQPDRGPDLTVEAEAYDGEVDQRMGVVTSLEPPYALVRRTSAPLSGGHLLGRVTRIAAGGGELEVQAYFDRLERRDPVLGGIIHTADIDLQHRLAGWGRHTVMWGVGYRRVADRYDTTLTVALEPASATSHLLGAFIQDEIRLTSESLRLTAGTKVEHNDYTGYELQPSLRMMWHPHDRHVVWAAVARAVRLPNRTEVGERVVAAVLPGDGVRPPTIVAVVGNPAYASEKVISADAGWRRQLGDRATIDVAAYRAWYDDLRTSEPEFPTLDPAFPGYLVIPVRARNLQRGTTAGLEVAVDWRLLPRWRLVAAATLQRMDMELKAGSTDAVAATFARENPRRLLTLRSSWDPAPGIALDLVGRYCGDLPALAVDWYYTLDARLAWQPRSGLEVSVAGRNLIDTPRLEYARQNVIVVPSRLQTSLRGDLTWRF